MPSQSVIDCFISRYWGKIIAACGKVLLKNTHGKFHYLAKLNFSCDWRVLFVLLNLLNVRFGLIYNDAVRVICNAYFRFHIMHELSFGIRLKGQISIIHKTNINDNAAVEVVINRWGLNKLHMFQTSFIDIFQFSFYFSKFCVIYNYSILDFYKSLIFSFLKKFRFIRKISRPKKRLRLINWMVYWWIWNLKDESVGKFNFFPVSLNFSM